MKLLSTDQINGMRLAELRIHVARLQALLAAHDPETFKQATTVHDEVARSAAARELRATRDAR